MKKAPSPAHYRWYPTNHPELAPMTRDQRDCYRTLWDYCLTLEGLPKDITELAAICYDFSIKDFEKDVWLKIKKHFYEIDGKLFVGNLEIHIKKDKKLRKLQTIKGKLRQAKKLEDQPTATRSDADLQPGTQIETQVDIGGQPEINQRLAEMEPEFSQLEAEIKMANMPDADYELVVSQPIAEPEPPADLKNEPEVIAPPVTQPEITKRKPESNTETILKSTFEAWKKKEEELDSKPSTFDRFAVDPDFDKEKEWKRIKLTYPGEGLNEEAKELFCREIINKRLYDRLWRAITRYRQAVLFDRKEAKSFIDWFQKWQVWEDSEPVKV